MSFRIQLRCPKMIIFDQFTRQIVLLLKGGSRSAIDVIIEEVLDERKKMLYGVTTTWNGRALIGLSEVGFFDALLKMRIEFENEEVLLMCFGASEDVYPSAMQQSMGPALSVRLKSSGVIGIICVSKEAV